MALETYEIILLLMKSRFYMYITIIFIFTLFLFSLTSCAEVIPNRKQADQIAREVAAWFTYTISTMNSDHLGQCGDFALRFVLKYNEYAGSNLARLVVANNPIPSGNYRIEEKVDIQELGIPGFDWDSSGFILWKGKTFFFHPVLGTYRIYLEKAWTPKTHFGINMLDLNQVHVWASIDGTSVDPTYFDLWPDRFPSPLGLDE